MDPYFDPSKSSTSKVLKCERDQRCYFRQSYSEGSSWHAFKVSDKLWVGGKPIHIYNMYVCVMCVYTHVCIYVYMLILINYFVFIC